MMIRKKFTDKHPHMKRSEYNFTEELKVRAPDGGLISFPIYNEPFLYLSSVLMNCDILLANFQY